jgi:hypothetical protein
VRVCYGLLISLLIVLVSGFLLVADAEACGGGCDPCLLVYSTDLSIYKYNSSKYYVVTSSHPLYDPEYDRGGEVLIRNFWFLPDRIATAVYQAPLLAGFEQAVNENTGYWFTGRLFDLVVDGFSRNPRVYYDVVLSIEPILQNCTPVIFVDGVLIEGPPYVIELGDLHVTTPDGDYYSDSFVMEVTYQGCMGLYMTAFEDCDHNKGWDPCPDNGDDDEWPCHRFCSDGATVPVEASTWGAIKAMYEK